MKTAMDPPPPGSYQLWDLDPPVVAGHDPLAVDFLIDENFPPPPYGDFICDDISGPMDANLLFPELMAEADSMCVPDGEARGRRRKPGKKKKMRYPHMSVDMRPRKRRKGAPVYREEDLTSVESGDEENRVPPQRAASSARDPLKPSNCGSANTAERGRNSHVQWRNTEVPPGAPSAEVEVRNAVSAHVRPAQPPPNPVASTEDGNGNGGAHSGPQKSVSKGYRQDLRHLLRARKRPMKSTFAERKRTQKCNKSGGAKEKPCLPTQIIECEDVPTANISEEYALLSRLQQSRREGAAQSSSREKENFLSEKSASDERSRDEDPALSHHVLENAPIHQTRPLDQNGKPVVHEQKQRHANQGSRDNGLKPSVDFSRPKKQALDKQRLSDGCSSRIDEIDDEKRGDGHASRERPDEHARRCATSKAGMRSSDAPAAATTERLSADHRQTFPSNDENARNAVRPIRRENRKSRDEFLAEEQSNRSKVLNAKTKHSLASEKTRAYIVGREDGRLLPRAQNLRNRPRGPRVPVGQHQARKDDPEHSKMFDCDSGKSQRHGVEEQEKLEKTINEHFLRQKQSGMSKRAAYSSEYPGGRGIVNPAASKRSFKGGRKGKAGKQGRFRGGRGRR